MPVCYVFRVCYIICICVCVCVCVCPRMCWNVTFANDKHTHTHIQTFEAQLKFRGKYALSSAEWSHEYVSLPMPMPCHAMPYYAMDVWWKVDAVFYNVIILFAIVHCTILFSNAVFEWMANEPRTKRTILSTSHIHCALWLVCECVSMLRCAMLSFSDMTFTMCLLHHHLKRFGTQRDSSHVKNDKQQTIRIYSDDLRKLSRVPPQHTHTHTQRNRTSTKLILRKRARDQMKLEPRVLFSKWRRLHV